MKFPPASRKASYTFRASSLAVPQPHSSPKVMVPRAASETRSPEFPKSRYLIAIFLFPFLEGLFFALGGLSSQVLTIRLLASLIDLREESSAGNTRSH